MRNKTMILLAVILFSVLSVTAEATVFQQMSYQGVLTESDGTRITGTRTLTFKIYNSEYGGAACWQKDTTMSIEEGIVNVILGPISVCDVNLQWWLGITVSGKSEMSPRIKLTAVPYSMNTDYLDGNDASAFYLKTQADDHTQNNIDADKVDGHHYSPVWDEPGDGYNPDNSPDYGVPGEPTRDQIESWGHDGYNPDNTPGLTTPGEPTKGQMNDWYVNEGQPNSITSGMIVNYTIQQVDLDPGISIPNADNADKVDGYHACNNSGCVPINNGVLNINLNADKWDSHNWGDLYPNADKVDGIHASSTPQANKFYPLDSQARFRLERDIDNESAILGINNGTGAAGVYGRTSGSGSAGVWGMAFGGSDRFGVYYSGGLAGTGTKSCVVKTSKGPTLLYCQESPENWFEDFGEGELVNGRSRVELDPLFLETVTISPLHPMKVFVQLEGDCNGVYVVKGTTGFDVNELRGGNNNVPFSYRVVAKRKGYEDERLRQTDVGKDDPNLYPELLQEIEKEPESGLE